MATIEPSLTPPKQLTGQDQYVKLNVGGYLFLTTVGTLTKYDSMLKAMFSGRMEVRPDPDGYVLIDRCGKHFGLILNFLREGTLPLPDCRTEVLEILVEAKYYLLQELVDHCYAFLKTLHHDLLVSTLGICRVPVVVSKKQVEQIVQSCAGKPVIELLLNRQNNKYSYNASSDENFLRNQELFDKLILRFNNRVLFIKNIGIGSSEICQWTFYGKTNRKVEICCTSIVYATDKKQTKVEFPEARIYEEALNVLLTFDQAELSGVCMRCRGPNDEGSGTGGSMPPNKWYDSLVAAELPAQLDAPPMRHFLSSGGTQQDIGSTANICGLGGSVMCNGRIDWRLEQLALSSNSAALAATNNAIAEEGGPSVQTRRRAAVITATASDHRVADTPATALTNIAAFSAGSSSSAVVPSMYPHQRGTGTRKTSECED